ncbi:MAG: uracil-DNA glycosylase [Ignavibacteriales bacterium CG12_big_fil_rev_8_21_14_0_65_30_8]|nr:MAG: uracil-DNA glycosylase [Ignavibacteriales bacterium CG12_big_fil_rev_8_21_14_0_65_30_8]
MNEAIKDRIIESLKDQKDIFGNELLEEINIKIEKNRKIETKSSTDNSDEWQSANSLQKLEELINGCQKCVLAKNRNKFVFGSGNPNADVMVIGEGPGAEEDKQGLPFVGRAGKLLTDILKAINFTRDEVFIANVVKCRPPGNRTPQQQEMDTCIPYLKKQIDLIKPKLILCLGLTAAQGILKLNTNLSSMRGKFYDFENTKVLVTYHPAALLRNPNWKKPAWEDVQKFRALYDELIKKN